jgi:hypothetical protein
MLQLFVTEQSWKCQAVSKKIQNVMNLSHPLKLQLRINTLMAASSVWRSNTLNYCGHGYLQIPAELQPAMNFMVFTNLLFYPL